MDLGTIIGLILMYAMLIFAVMLGVGLGPYINLPAFLIVVGGAFGALLVGFKLDQLKLLGSLMGVAVKPQTYDVPALINKLVQYATMARRDGILALETPVNQEDDIFLKKGLSMAVDGNDPDVIRQLLELETEESSNRHKTNASMFDQFGAMTGAFGMIGTLIGLVAMLVNMNDPASIGPAMAVALITTLYGAILANTIGIPVSNLLLIRDKDEVLVRTLVVEGIMSIQAGDNPRTLEAKLLSFLPPSERTSNFE
jgi:chemotaxis protein MotA